MSDTKHGWVTPRADGARARCGGPGVCATCDTEAMHEAMLTGCFGVVPTATPSWLDGGADAVEMAREDGLLPAAPSKYAGDHDGMQDDPRTRWQQPATPPASAQNDAKDGTDRFRAAYMEWQEKTDFIQQRIAAGDLPVKYLGWHRADVMRDLIDAAQARAEMFRLERDYERAKNERLIAILVGIHGLTLPAPVVVDGKTYVFTPPEAAEILRALSDRIRAIPGEIAASQQQEG